MNKFVKSIFDLDELEQFARRDLWINHFHPGLKIMITLVYILLLTSVDKYAISTILIFGVYPILLFSIADVPVASIMSKLLVPIFASVSLGLFNPLIDREVMLHIGEFGISGGMISLLTLVVKASYSLSATLLLVSTTTIEHLGKGLSFFRLPPKLIMLFLLMYRYIGVLLNEVYKTMEAYHLRSSGKGIDISAWGSLVGQIGIRSYRRSEEIYNAMLLRGYSPEERSSYDK